LFFTLVNCLLAGRLFGMHLKVEYIGYPLDYFKETLMLCDLDATTGQFTNLMPLYIWTDRPDLLTSVSAFKQQSSELHWAFAGAGPDVNSVHVVPEKLFRGLPLSTSAWQINAMNFDLKTGDMWIAYHTPYAIDWQGPLVLGYGVAHYFGNGTLGLNPPLPDPLKNNFSSAICSGGGSVYYLGSEASDTRAQPTSYVATYSTRNGQLTRLVQLNDNCSFWFMSAWQVNGSLIRGSAQLYTGKHTWLDPWQFVVFEINPNSGDCYYWEIPTPALLDGAATYAHTEELMFLSDSWEPASLWTFNFNNYTASQVELGVPTTTSGRIPIALWGLGYCEKC